MSGLLSGRESGGRPPTVWTPVCPVGDLLPDRPVCAKVGDNQVAVVLTAGDGELYAIDNHDPFSGANVLSRGIVGSVGERVVLVSPMFKQHFELATGRCVEDPAVVLDTFEVRQTDGWVEVADGPLS